MRVKFLTMGMSLALAFALVTEISAVTALGQNNTNQSNANSSRRRRGRRPPPPRRPLPNSLRLRLLRRRPILWPLKNRPGALAGVKGAAGR